MLSMKGFHVVERPWGEFLQFTENEKVTVKLLNIKKGQSTSYQYHNFRSEQWYVISGSIWVTKEIRDGRTSYKLNPHDMETIEIKQKHKFEGLEDSTVLEISKGFFDENDIVRL